MHVYVKVEVCFYDCEKQKNKNVIKVREWTESKLYLISLAYLSLAIRMIIKYSSGIEMWIIQRFVSFQEWKNGKAQEKHSPVS